MNSFTTVKEDEQKKLIQGLEEEKTNLTRKLRITQKLLDEQLEKINAHVSKARMLSSSNLHVYTGPSNIVLIRSSSDSNPHSYDFPPTSNLKRGVWSRRSLG